MTEVDRRKRGFYKSMFLECVCDTEREAFLKAINCNSLESFKGIIEDQPYDDLLDFFAKMMNAKNAIMFQERKRQPLTNDLNSRSIIILSRSTKCLGDRIGILRSELLDFYNATSDGAPNRPASRLLIDIKDTVRVVEVAERQHDPVVGAYSRDACVIVYIQLNYMDQLSVQSKSIYFAFFLDTERKDNLTELLDSIRKFLSFRYDLKLRIEKDFNGNLYGEKMEVAWCNAWLSIEKAGSHTDSSGISRLLKEADFESSDIMEVLFSDCDAQVLNANKKTTYQFIYNVCISMYYRMAISQGDHSAVDDIIEARSTSTGRYYLLEDVLKFLPVDEKIILYGTGACSDSRVMEEINKAKLFGKKSKLKNSDGVSTGGIPAKKTLTMRRRYLQAFLMDILSNADKRKKEATATRIYLERSPNGPGYFVVSNEVPLGTDDEPEAWCLKKNYELKQATEFDHAADPNAKKGMSLGCIAHCMKDYGSMVVRYRHQNGHVFFEIKLPIIQS